MLVAQASDDRKDLKGFIYYEEQGHNQQNTPGLN